MWPQAMWSNEGLQTIAVFLINVVGLALMVVAVVVYAHATGRPPLVDQLWRLAQHVQRARHAMRLRSRWLLVLGQKAFLRYADLLAGVLTNLAEAITRAAERARASTRHHDPRFG